jgi:regulator of protease activity HflC (stomatin/prohibitin superfamily)
MIVPLLALLLIAYFFIKFTIVYVNYVVVTATIGRRFSRILKEGYYLLHPLEGILEYDWTYTNQDFKTIHLKGEKLRLADSQIDLAPIECETIDHIVVSLDTMLMYNVEDPYKAMYATEDPLNLLCQQINRCARREVVRYKRDQLAENEELIAKAICEAIAKEWTPIYGLLVKRCEIQNISHDEDTVRRRRQIRDGLSPYEKANAIQGSNVIIKK